MGVHCLEQRIIIKNFIIFKIFFHQHITNVYKNQDFNPGCKV